MKILVFKLKEGPNCLNIPCRIPQSINSSREDKQGDNIALALIRENIGGHD